MRAQRHLKTLVADEIRFILERDSRLLVPVGTCEQHGPHLPLGCDTIIVERLADDLSASFDILRAPTIEYRVDTPPQPPYARHATVRPPQAARYRGAMRSLPERSPGSLGRPTLASGEKGERLYKMIYERIATRVLGAPVPPAP